MAINNADAALVFKGLADESRLEIMAMLMSGEKCACQLLAALDIGQSTLSHHMRILCEAGLVTARKSGKWTHYSLSAEGSVKVRKLIQLYTLSPKKASSYKKCDCCDE